MIILMYKLEMNEAHPAIREKGPQLQKTVLPISIVKLNSQAHLPFTPGNQAPSLAHLPETVHRE